MNDKTSIVHQGKSYIIAKRIVLAYLETNRNASQEMNISSCKGTKFTGSGKLGLNDPPRSMEISSAVYIIMTKCIYNKTCQHYVFDGYQS